MTQLMTIECDQCGESTSITTLAQHWSVVQITIVPEKSSRRYDLCPRCTGRLVSAFLPPSEPAEKTVIVDAKSP